MCPKGFVESPVPSNRHAGFGGRPEETGWLKGQYRASGRPYVVLCTSESEARDLKTKLAAWLQPRGLSFNEEKTRIVHLADGFDFLGFNVRRYGQKLIIKPSKDAVQRAKEKIRTVIRQHRGAPAERLANALGPLVRGWSIYYRHVVSKETFRKLDDFTHHALRRWAIYCNRRKTPRWLRERYWGRFDKGREDRWVFGSEAGYLPKFAWTGIVRHVMVKETPPGTTRNWTATGGIDPESGCRGWNPNGFFCWQPGRRDCVPDAGRT
ncbi:group II intron maturase-specific domain-containing protein [Streptomyces aureus]